MIAAGRYLVPIVWMDTEQVTMGTRAIHLNVLVGGLMDRMHEGWIRCDDFVAALALCAGRAQRRACI